MACATLPLLNRVLTDTMEAAGALNARAALAAPALGAGWPCSLLELAVWRRLQDGLAQAIGKTAADLPALWRSLGLLS